MSIIRRRFTTLSTIMGGLFTKGGRCRVRNGRVGEWIGRETVFSYVIIWRRSMLPMRRRRMLIVMMIIPSIMTPLMMNRGGHVGILITNHGIVRIVPRKSLQRKFITPYKRLPQTVIPCQVNPFNSRNRRASPGFEPRNPLIPGMMILLSLALLHGSFLPQRLTRLLPRLLIPHVVPVLGLVILLQKSSGGIQCSPIINNPHRHQRLVQSLGFQISFLAIFHQFAIAFVPRVVIGASAAAEEAVVLAGFGDALEGPGGAACSSCVGALDLLFGGWRGRRVGDDVVVVFVVVVPSFFGIGRECHRGIIPTL
mmetsp:Transcript_18583/g.33269  ORF Transcript_18583/g.33269 Transcript_18583/m.33269 type:complete len:310 (+) Transcript_18583:443-1372(+)